MEIDTVFDTRRGCGFRKPGGFYLVSEPWKPEPCGRLPLLLEACPVCGAGTKPARGWTWINLERLASEWPCAVARDEDCRLSCTMRKPPARAGLLWIGERFYKTVGAFLEEAAEQGVSRRIGGIPRDFLPGVTWIALAHRKGICVVSGPAFAESTEKPAIFALWRPRQIEYVVKGTETDAELGRLVLRGIIPVKVERKGEA